MKKIFSMRWQGLAIFGLWCGFILGSLIGKPALLIVIPLTLAWLMDYDDVSYDFKERRNGYK